MKKKLNKNRVRKKKEKRLKWEEYLHTSPLHIQEGDIYVAKSESDSIKNDNNKIFNWRLAVIKKNINNKNIKNNNNNYNK